jgi:radical SAM superfamily enzyme YgiQ (UPF0313 family)
MRILLVWPKFPITFWSFRYALPFIGKKAAYPPLGLLTLASLFPKKWEKRLVDLNVEKLKDKDILWADFIFVSAMVVQKQSVEKVVERAKKLGKKIVAGGPLFTTGFEEYTKDIDHFVLGEGEITFPQFVKDFENGSLKKIYQADKFVDIKETPLPSWELINMKKYASMSIQYSRGCPFNCEFCDIVLLNGRGQRSKNKEQILEELDALYNLGWRGGVFFVDDNLIGNKRKLKEEVLPAIIEWMQEKKYPFHLNTQVSINLADDEELMKLMTKAGFNSVFVGIESPSEQSLAECGKFQNTNRNLLESIRIIQTNGLQVQGGFIIGFDHDTPSIFDGMINFIQNSGVITAMVGLLQAAPKTRLWNRLKKEKRLIKEATGNNTEATLNFIPKMDSKILIDGYKRVMNTIYSPKNYYQRLITFLKQYKPQRRKLFKITWDKVSAFLKSIWFLGIAGKERLYYWKLLFWSLFKKPYLFPLAVELAIYGFHFRKISENNL